MQKGLCWHILMPLLRYGFKACLLYSIQEGSTLKSAACIHSDNLYKPLVPCTECQGNFYIHFYQENTVGAFRLSQERGGQDESGI